MEPIRFIYFCHMKQIQENFPALNALQIGQFNQLGDLYKEWNDKINLVSRKDIDQLYTNHILHSLAIAKWIRFVPHSSILDVGTGGGFPGIPLAILFPDSHFDLVDSIGKKITVVDNISDQIGLQNISAFHKRAEQMPEGQYDFIVTRAVAPLSTLEKWTKTKVKKENKNAFNNGIIALKGGDLTEELANYESDAIVTPINSYFSDSFFETKKIVYLPL